MGKGGDYRGFLSGSTTGMELWSITKYYELLKGGG